MWPWIPTLGGGERSVEQAMTNSPFPSAPRGNTGDQQKHKVHLVFEDIGRHRIQAADEIIESGIGNIRFWPIADISFCAASVRFRG